MKRKLISILLFSIILGTLNICGCGKNTPLYNKQEDKSTINSKEKLPIVKKHYSYNEDGKVVEIDYPSTGDKKVDKEIIDEALDPLDDYTKNNKTFNITLNSKSYLTSNNILSILYTGLFSSKDTAHPTNLLYSTNMDLNSKETIELEDILTINNKLLNILKTKGTIVSSTNSQNLLNEQENIIKNYTLNELKDIEDNFYLTKESLGLIIEASHALGNYIKVEISYKDLGDLIYEK